MAALQKFYLPKRILAIFIVGSFVSCSGNKEIKVGVQPFTGLKSSIADTVAKVIETTYSVKVHILNPATIPSDAFINVKTPRYRADKLIRYLRNRRPDSLDYMVGLTSKDISIAKLSNDGSIKKPEAKYNDWGVFGYGYMPGESCIVSSYRLTNTSDRVVFDRIKKVSLHELGHNLGLDHCESADCVMRDAAEKINTIDNVSDKLCKVCRQKLE